MQMQFTNGKVRLSPREAQVALRVCQGETNRQIADALKIGEATVGQYLSQLYSALRFSSRHELVLWGMSHPQAIFERGWVDPAIHPPGCQCMAPYCVTMRPAAEPILT